MARIDQNLWPELPAKQLNNPVVIVIDMVNGFAKAGALADPAIELAAKPIEELLIRLHPQTWFICDSHPEDAAEFSSFPPHCTIGSEEQQILSVLQPYAKTIIEKNCISAFAVDAFRDLLKTVKYPADFVLTGCCTDLCVEQLALPLQSWLNQMGYAKSRVIIPVDCVDTYDIPEVHDAAAENALSLKRMASSGVLVVSKIKFPEGTKGKEQ